MGTSAGISKSGVWLVLSALGIAAGQSAACSSKFSSCYESRTCPEAQAEAGAAGDESGGTGGQIAQPTAGREEPAGDGGEAGETFAGAAGMTPTGSAGAPLDGGTGGMSSAGQSGGVAVGGGGTTATGSGGTTSNGGGGTGGSTGPVGCNAVVLSGPFLNPQSLPGDAPAGTKGIVRSGNYQLTKLEFFNDAPGFPARSALQVSVSNSVVTIQGIDEIFFNELTQVPTRYTKTLATNTPVTITTTCSDPTGTVNIPGPSDYSATSDTLVLYGSGYRTTYTKQ